MNDIVAKLASSCGISPEQVEKGLGAILALIKSKLPAESFAKLSAAMPDADALATAAGTGADTAGGLMGAVTGAVGKLFGGGAGDAVAKLSAAGFSPEQLQGFLPKVLEYLKSILPADVMAKIGGLLPIPEEASK